MIHPAWEKELMWAAGFFDGEGHCHCHRGLRIMITQRHREPLERFAAAFAVGKIIETERDGRPLFHYYPQNSTDTRYVAELLLSRVSEIKREQIGNALAAYEHQQKNPQPRGRKKGSPGAVWTQEQREKQSRVIKELRNRKVA